LASRGFLCVVADYRLTPDVRYPAFMQDAAAAVRWVRDHAAAYGGDPGRISLAGHSAGAYIALQLALDTEFLSAAQVDPGLIRSVAGLSGPYDFLPLQVESTQAAFGGYPDLPATQPINHVHAGAPPAFLAHGSKDTLVEVRNTLALGKALAAAGDVVEVKIYPGLSHPDTVLALSLLLRGKAPILEDMTSFIRAHDGAD
jgi:acetyl esterase/lipase